MSDLDNLIIEPRVVPFNGRDVAIAPLKVGKIPAIARALKGANITGEIDVLALLADHGDGLLEAVSIATGIDKIELEAADLDEFAALFRAVIEVNNDFFTRKILPILGGVNVETAAHG